jgi:hypothetical protein
VSQVPSFSTSYISPFELHNLDNNKFARTIQEQIQPSAPTPASPILTLVEAINKANQLAIANAINETQEEIDAESWGSVDSWEEYNPRPKTPQEEEVIVTENPLPKEDQEASPKPDWQIRLEERGEGSKPLISDS